jgi:hypothetical protein
MSFTGDENHDFPLQTASEWTKNYRNASAATATKAHFFGKAAIQAILNQEGCVGIRIYYALDASGNKQLIIVGADANENDLYQGLIAERSSPCPARCSSVNPLNT